MLSSQLTPASLCPPHLVLHLAPPLLVGPSQQRVELACRGPGRVAWIGVGGVRFTASAAPLLHKASGAPACSQASSARQLSHTQPHSPKLPPPTVAHGDGGQRVAGVAARLGGELKVKVAAALSDALQPGRAEEAMAWAAEQLEQRCPYQSQHRSRHIAGSQTK